MGRRTQAEEFRILKEYVFGGKNRPESRLQGKPRGSKKQRQPGLEAGIFPQQSQETSARHKIISVV